ncbi:hypothetical protein [Aureimonas sp. SK2]|uniref:hypothetical protein n=1 Tax=Aureimonas sp. SK2 TaxID=3015992 RepID=UPI002444DE3D|nr:hypothetical protein [Aureimonas sp. SK2]
MARDPARRTIGGLFFACRQLRAGLACQHHPVARLRPRMNWRTATTTTAKMEPCAFRLQGFFLGVDPLADFGVGLTIMPDLRDLRAPPLHPQRAKGTVR